MDMSEKRTKADRLERQTEQLGKRVERHPDEIEKQPPLEGQIKQRAYELYERRGWGDGHELEDWLQAEREIKGRRTKSEAA